MAQAETLIKRGLRARPGLPPRFLTGTGGLGALDTPPSNGWADAVRASLKLDGWLRAVFNVPTAVGTLGDAAAWSPWTIADIPKAFETGYQAAVAPLSEGSDEDLADVPGRAGPAFCPLRPCTEHLLAVRTFGSHYEVRSTCGLLLCKGNRRR